WSSLRPLTRKASATSVLASTTSRMRWRSGPAALPARTCRQTLAEVVEPAQLVLGESCLIEHAADLTLQVLQPLREARRGVAGGRNVEAGRLSIVLDRHGLVAGEVLCGVVTELAYTDPFHRRASVMRLVTA